MLGTEVKLLEEYVTLHGDEGPAFSALSRIKTALAELGTSHNTAREKFSAINCTGCYWRERCVCHFGSKVCRIKWEPKTSPVA